MKAQALQQCVTRVVTETTYIIMTDVSSLLLLTRRRSYIPSPYNARRLVVVEDAAFYPDVPKAKAFHVRATSFIVVRRNHKSNRQTGEGGVGGGMAYE